MTLKNSQRKPNFNQIEWAGVRFGTIRKKPHNAIIVFYDLVNPINRINYTDIGYFYSFNQSINLATLNKFDAIISREAIEFLSYEFIQSIKKESTEYDPIILQQLHTIITNTPDHTNRVHILVLLEKNIAPITQFLHENYSDLFDDQCPLKINNLAFLAHHQ